MEHRDLEGIDAALGNIRAHHGNDIHTDSEYDRTEAVEGQVDHRRTLSVAACTGTG